MIFNLRSALKSLFHNFICQMEFFPVSSVLGRVVAELFCSWQYLFNPIPDTSVTFLRSRPLGEGVFMGGNLLIALTSAHLRHNINPTSRASFHK